MKIDLTKLETLVLTIHSNEERYNRLNNVLGNKLKLKKYCGLTLPRPLGCDLSLIKMWNVIKPPVLILEDDCYPTEFFKTELDVPDDADVVHIGTSGWGVTNGRSDWNNFNLTKYNDDYYRVFGMTSFHATLFLTQKYLNSLISIGEKYPVLCDVGGFGIDYYTCQEQYKYNVYGIAKPLVYQNDHSTEGMTLYPLEEVFKTKYL